MSENRLQKIASQGLVNRTDIKISTTNKLLIIGQQEWIISIFLQQPKFFIDILSLYHSLPERFLGQFDSNWDWELLSSNESLIWSILLVEKFEDKWSWDNLSENYSLFDISAELSEKYKSRLNFYLRRPLFSTSMLGGFGDDPNWSFEESISYDSDDWNYFSSDADDVPWSLQLIKQFQDKWNWSALSLNERLQWSLDFIRELQDKWDWNSLSYNEFLPWSLDFIKEFEDKWDWDDLWRMKKVYEVFKPYLNDEFIEEIMLRITQEDS